MWHTSKYELIASSVHQCKYPRRTEGTRQWRTQQGYVSVTSEASRTMKAAFLIALDINHG